MRPSGHASLFVNNIAGPSGYFGFYRPHGARCFGACEKTAVALAAPMARSIVARIDGRDELRPGGRAWKDSAHPGFQHSGEIPARDAGKGRPSKRELEVAMLAAAGMSNREIGQRLCISAFTVRDHLHSAFKKLGVNNRAMLAGALTVSALSARDGGAREDGPDAR